jgi:hypothetical protein
MMEEKRGIRSCLYRVLPEEIPAMSKDRATGEEIMVKWIVKIDHKLTWMEAQTQRDVS